MRTRGVIACLFVLTVFIALAWRVPDVIDRPLLSGVAGAPVGVPLPFASTVGTESLRDITLRVRDAAELGQYDQIQLVFGTFDTSPVLRYGWLHVAGTTCSFQAPRQKLRENGKVAFRRAGGCAGSRGGPATATLRLAMEGPARYARAAIWTSAPDPRTAPLLTIAAFDQVLGVAGRTIVERSGPSVRRVALLAFMWELRVRWLLALLAIASALVVAGALVAGRATAGPSALASFALAAGLALFYAVAVPPFQAPDEPDHLLSFAKLTERPALADATSTWAKRIHFYRMTFRADERFTPADREQSFDLDWPPADVFAENVRHRSSTTTRLWQGLDRIVPANPSHALLFLRITQAILFGGAFAAGATLMAWGTAASLPGLLALVVLAIPTLPFFAMQLSELTFTIAAYILAGYATVLLLNGAAGRVTGPMLGLAIALLAAGPRGGWPSLVVIAALAAGRLLTAAAERTRPRADTTWFWGGIAAPAVLLFATRFLWIPSPFYEQWHLATLDPRAGVSSGTFLLAVAAGAAAGGLAERLLIAASPVAAAAAQAARGVCALGALAIAGTLAWSFRAPLPRLSTVETLAPASAAAYVKSVMLPLVTAARVRGFDFLTWTSLWGGFGWADAILPSPAIALVTIVAACAAIATLVAAARDKSGSRALLTLCGMAGLAACAATIALSSFGLHRNVHGRYLLGACVIGVCLLAAPAVVGKDSRIPAGARAAALLALGCGLHAFALSFLLERYFG